MSSPFPYRNYNFSHSVAQESIQMSWAAELKRGLKLARTTIDMALDIRDEPNEFINIPVLDSDLTPVIEDELLENIDDKTNAVGYHGNDTWGWSVEAQSLPVVDTEPNPILDQCMNPASSVHQYTDHTPSSGSNTEQLSPALSTKDTEYEEVGQDGTVEINLSTDNHEVHNEASIRRGSHEETLTVASSDIEVVKNLDAWSFASSARQMTDDVLGRSASKLVVTPDPAVSTAIRIKNDNRVADLKRQNTRLTQENTQLRLQLQKAIQSQCTMKKEMDSLEDNSKCLREEGEKMSTENGKIRNELRRAKESLSAAENAREKFKNKTVKLEKELEDVYENLQKTIEEKEALQSQTDQHTKTIIDLQCRLEEAQKQLDAVSSEASIMQVKAIGAEELAKANEESLAALQKMHSEWQSSIIEVQRLDSQLKSTLELSQEVTQEKNSLKETVTKLEQQLDIARCNSDQGNMVSSVALKASEQRCENLAEELALCMEEKINMAQELETLIEKNKYDQEKIVRLTSEKQELFRQLDQCQMNIATREQSCVCKQFDLNKLTTGLHKAESELRNVRAASNQRESELSFIISQHEFNIVSLNREVQELKMNEEELRKEIFELKQESVKQPHQKEVYHNVSAELQAALIMNGELLERNRELEHDLRDLKDASKLLQEDLLRNRSREAK